MAYLIRLTSVSWPRNEHQYSAVALWKSWLKQKAALLPIYRCVIST